MLDLRLHSDSHSDLSQFRSIVETFEIRGSDGQIFHPDFPYESPPKAAQEHFQSLPIDLQQRLLMLELQDFLYHTTFNGAALAAREELPLLMNHTKMGMNPEFFRLLHEHNGGRGYFQPHWDILAEEEDGILAVYQDELTLHVSRTYLHESDRDAIVGDEVAIWVPKNTVEDFYYVAIGNEGPIYDRDPNAINLFLNLRSEAASSVMHQLTHSLNAAAIPFTLKLLHDSGLYQRYDSGILSVDRSDADYAIDRVQSVYTEYRSLFNPDVPLMTKRLAAGVAIAESPGEDLCFGLHRCGAIAQGMIDAHFAGDDSPEGRLKSVQQHFANIRIDFDRPYLNSGNEDIYAAF